MSISVEPAPFGLRMTVQGDIDQDFVPDSMSSLEVPRVELDLSNVRRIDSAGVRAWIHFVRNLPPDTTVTLEGCPPAFVLQANSVRNFLHGAQIESFAVPYICPQCETPRDELFTVQAVRELHCVLPPVGPCLSCGSELEADVDVPSYLAFLEEPNLRPRPSD